MCVGLTSRVLSREASLKMMRPELGVSYTTVYVLKPFTTKFGEDTFSRSKVIKDAVLRTGINIFALSKTELLELLDSVCFVYIFNGVDIVNTVLASYPFSNSLFIKNSAQALQVNFNTLVRLVEELISIYKELKFIHCVEWCVCVC